MTYDPSKHVRVRRSAGNTADGNMVRIGTPKAITLTARPANERPYQVIRSDEQASQESNTAAPAPAPVARRVTRNVRRSDNPVIMLTFPVGFTEDDVSAALVEFEMTTYTVQCDDAGIYTALRSDLQSIANIQRTDIKLNAAGVIASLDASQYSVQRAENKDNIALVSYEFDVKRFDADAASQWLAQNDVDSTKFTVENASDNSLVVKRSEVADGVDTRRVQLEEGVVAVIARSDTADVPSAFTTVISDAAYGNWGWGHIDFSAAMADYEFCKVMDDANWKLRGVLDNIIFYSQLPLEQRKQLIDRSLGQYGDFVKSLIDALPRQVMMLVTRAAETKESNDMATTQTTGGNATKDDAPVTRAEIKGLMAEVLKEAGITTQRAEVTAAPAAAAAQAATTEATTQRSEEGTGVAATATTAAPAAVTGESLTRSDVATMLADAMKPVTEQLQSIANTAVVRSDNGDAGANVKQTSNKRNDPFGGMFSHLRNKQ